MVAPAATLCPPPNPPTSSAAVFITLDRSSPRSISDLLALAETLIPSSASAKAKIGRSDLHSGVFSIMPATMPTTVSLISDPASKYWMKRLSLIRWLLRMNVMADEMCFLCSARFLSASARADGSPQHILSPVSASSYLPQEFRMVANSLASLRPVPAGCFGKVYISP